ncbi:MAG: hypothetical protein U1C18_00715 [Patescibacteria group bacterium]|nr:hypothetical protein [bacterium]MDZ4221377.1 hypothetical protein [Patescibacteria group bacterium]
MFRRLFAFALVALAFAAFTVMPAQAPIQALSGTDMTAISEHGPPTTQLVVLAAHPDNGTAWRSVLGSNEVVGVTAQIDDFLSSSSAPDYGNIDINGIGLLAARASPNNAFGTDGNYPTPFN